MLTRRLSLAVVAILMAHAGALAQPPGVPKLNYSYCRFDSATIALCDQSIPSPIYSWMATSGLDARMIPLFLTVEDVQPAPDAPHYKVMYVTNGKALGVLMIFKRGGDGSYKFTAESQRVSPAGHVNLRILDVNGDGRKDVIASARGGEPELYNWGAFEIFNDRLRLMTKTPTGPYDTRATFGIGVAPIDSLGRNGRPGVEVWQDDSTHFGERFVRIVQQYSDSTQSFVPERIDTVSVLPFWCKGRREKKD